MKITFITTGGSIDKDYPKATKGYGFEITDPAVVRILEQVNLNFKFEIVPVLQKDSLDITEEDREMILEACKSANSDKIIITHGIDTMFATAEKLSMLGDMDKVMILVGAQKPERFSDSDAAFNLGCAVGAANALANGVYIAMNGRVYRWDKCKRDDVTGKFVEK